MGTKGVLRGRGWELFGQLRRAPYSGAARYATENGEAGSAADNVREHWARRQVSATPGSALLLALEIKEAWNWHIVLPVHSNSGVQRSEQTERPSLLARLERLNRDSAG